MEAQKNRNNKRKKHHVNRKKSVEGYTRDQFTAFHQFRDSIPNDGEGRGHRGCNRSRPVAQLTPRKKIATDTEDYGGKQHQGSQYPGKLSGLFISSHEKYREGMEKNHDD